MTKILCGRPVAEKIIDDAARRSKKLHAQGITPTLAVVLVGNDPASLIYVRAKKKVAKQIGVDFLLYSLPAAVSQEDVQQLLVDLHLDDTIHGVLIQLPLPDHLDLKKLCAFLDPDKDIENFTNRAGFMPPTPAAVIALMKHYGIGYHGKRVAIIGQGFLVGQPLLRLLHRAGASVESYDKDTDNIARYAAKADVLICAAGCPFLVDSKFTNVHQVIIDVGNARGGPNNELIGDVDVEDVNNKVYAMTPRVGGVGPVTVALLMKNVIEAAEKQT